MTRVLLIGAGGLGGPIAYALAAAEIALTVCDDDVVEFSNLQRQIQFGSADLGRRKVHALADELARHGHGRTSLTPIAERFCADSADRLLAGMELVIDASDDPATKFLANDQAMARSLPVIIASASHYRGQIFVLDPRAESAREQGCYRCLFEEPPTGEEADGASCALAGVLGATVAFIGGLAAHAALDLVSGGPLFESRAPGGMWIVDDVRRVPGPRPTRATHYAVRADCAACQTRGRAQANQSRTNDTTGVQESWPRSVSRPH